MQKRLLSVLLAAYSLPAVALEGIHFSHKDWEIACDNTGTCRMAGYSAEKENEIPVSLYFERKAGKQELLGKGRFADIGENKSDADIGKTELFINQKTLGELQSEDCPKCVVGEFKLTPQQTNSVLEGLKGDAKVEVRNKVLGVNAVISNQGATAVMLKMDEFQKRLDTPSALVKKGESKKSVLAPQPKPRVIIPTIKQNEEAAEIVKQGTPRYKKLWALIKPYGKWCNNEKEGESTGQNNKISVRQLDNKHKLIGTVCYGGSYNSDGIYLLTDLKEQKVIWHSDEYTYNDKGRLVREFKGRGLGDCVSISEAAWNGKAFVPVTEYSTGQCRGFPGGAWELPTLVSDVIEK